MLGLLLGEGTRLTAALNITVDGFVTTASGLKLESPRALHEDSAEIATPESA